MDCRLRSRCDPPNHSTGRPNCSPGRSPAASSHWPHANHASACAGPIGWAVGASVLLSLAIETSQLAIPARDVDATSIVLALFGSASGAAAVVLSREHDPHRLIMPAIAIWCLAVIFTLWNPPRFTCPEPPYWNLAMVVPFWSYFFSRTSADLADVIGQVLIFMPLGRSCSPRAPTASHLWATLMIGLSLGVLFEFGQAFLPGRAADISDALSAAAGTAVGLGPLAMGRVDAARARSGRSAIASAVATAMTPCSQPRAVDSSRIDIVPILKSSLTLTRRTTWNAYITKKPSAKIRTKIVATLGPASSDAGCARPHGRRRRGCLPAEFLARHA